MPLSSKNSQHFLTKVVIGFLALLSLQIQAEQVLKAGGYNIHYNAFNSSMLTAEIAKGYDIQRSKSLGVINISVINDSDKAVSAYIDGHGKTALAQLKSLQFTQIKEGDAIYYIATFDFADKEQLIFDIQVVPEGEKHRTKLNFSQRFFVE